MQRLFTLIVLFAITFTAHAQINEVQIGSNPILQKEAAKEKQRIDNILQQIEADRKIEIPQTEDTFFENATCLFNGESIEICIDTLGYSSEGATLTFCDTPNFGSASFPTDTSCFVYVANTGITSMNIDSLCIEFCYGNNICDTIIYPMIIHRDNDTITLALTTLNVEESIEICPPINLPSTFATGEITSSPQVGTAYSAADCIFYESQLFAGLDTVVFEVCDDLCVCDTYIMPFNIIGDTLSLPFMDDFSYDGPYPDKTNWLDKNVFVNNHMALEPVSIGVATFDGLNSRGAPRGNSFGESDVLTSAYLDLSTGSDIFLSFYIEPEGLGDTPADPDSLATLILEFKNSLGDWVEIAAYHGHEEPNNEFTFDAHPISLSQYRYNGFQFRFRNFSKRTGNIDHWHLDYVRLMANSNDGEIYKDLAFTRLPNSILKTYSSMPWWQFEGFENEELQTDSIYSDIHFHNHSDAIIAITDNLLEGHTIDEVSSSTSIATNQILDGNQANRAVGFSSNNSTTVANGYDDVKDKLSTDFPGFTYVELDRTFTFPSPSNEVVGVPPVIRNNTVTRKIFFDNYFSYDDNTAETGIEASKKNTLIAVKYHANMADTVKAVQMHFPHIVTNTSSQSFNLKVWIGELDEEAEYTGAFEKPLYIDSYLDSLNGFATYILRDELTGERTPLAIPAGDFYVGWEQVSDCEIFKCIAIGNDKNRPEGMQDVFVDGEGTGYWQAALSLNPTLEGSLMIRPVVGAGEPMQSSNTQDFISNSRFNIFPNPTNGQINIDIDNGEYHQFTYSVFNTVGQLLEKNELAPQIDLNRLENGIYFIKIMNKKSNQIVNHKVIIAK